MLFLLCVCSLASIVSPRTQQPRTANNNKHCINNRSRWLQDLSKHYDCFRVWIGCMWTLKCSGNVYIGHFFSFTMREHGERHHYEFQAGLWLARSVCITSFFNLIGGALTAPSSHSAKLSQRHSAVSLGSLGPVEITVPGRQWPCTCISPQIFNIHNIPKISDTYISDVWISDKNWVQYLRN